MCPTTLFNTFSRGMCTACMIMVFLGSCMLKCVIQGIYDSKMHNKTMKIPTRAFWSNIDVFRVTLGRIDVALHRVVKASGLNLRFWSNDDGFSLKLFTMPGHILVYRDPMYIFKQGVLFQCIRKQFSEKFRPITLKFWYRKTYKHSVHGIMRPFILIIVMYF